MKNLVALNGKIASGKSTIAQQLISKGDYEIISISTTIRSVCDLLITTPSQLTSYLIASAVEEKDAHALADSLKSYFTNTFVDSEWIIDESNKTFLKSKSYRILMQGVATLVRDYFNDDSIWVSFLVQTALRKADNGNRIICDDLRLKEEKLIFENSDFVIIRLETEESVRLDRIAKTYGTIDWNVINHKTETDLDNEPFDIVVDTTYDSPEACADSILNFLN